MIRCVGRHGDLFAAEPLHRSWPRDQVALIGGAIWSVLESSCRLARRGACLLVREEEVIGGLRAKSASCGIGRHNRAVHHIRVRR